MKITDKIPEWYGKNRDSGGDPIPFSRAPLERFCARFRLTKGQALEEIARCKIYSCEPYNSLKIILGEYEPSIIPLAEFDRYAAIIAAEKELAPEPKKIVKRHIIKEEERKAKKKSAIQAAVESYFATSSPSHNRSGFYDFLKDKIKLENKAILQSDQSYAFFFKEVKEKGKQQGVYLNHPKEGKKEGEAGWNHYPGSDISTLLSKEQSRRKKLTE